MSGAGVGVGVGEKWQMANGQMANEDGAVVAGVQHLGGSPLVR